MTAGMVKLRSLWISAICLKEIEAVKYRLEKSKNDPAFKMLNALDRISV